MTFPRLLHTVVDAPDARALAEFYRELLGLQYRPGDEGEGPAGWLVLVDETGRRVMAFQQVERLERTTWPTDDVPMQLHLDFTVPDRATLDEQHARALALGALELLDRTDDAAEPLHVYADPAGHPFCVFVG